MAALALGFSSADALTKTVELCIERPCRSASDQPGKSMGFLDRHFIPGKEPPEDPPDMKICLEIAQILDLARVFQCADDHPRELLADTHAIEPLENLSGGLVLPNSPGIASIPLHDFTTNPPDSHVRRSKTVQAVEFESRFPVRLAYGVDRVPEIVGVAKLYLGQPSCVLPCPVCKDLVIDNRAENELVGRFLVTPVPLKLAQPRPMSFGCLGLRKQRLP